MSADPNTQSTDQSTDESTDDQQQTAAATTEQSGAQAATATDQQQAATDVASLPDWAQKLIRETRDEAATYRTKHKEVTEQHQASLDAIAKALGLKSDDDPATAAKTAAEERDAARQEAKAAKVEAAVMRAALKHGANPEALTDSRSFMGKLSDLDPAAGDFATRLDETIKSAVEANPTLKAATTSGPAPRSGGPVNGGTPKAGQLSREDLQAMKPEDIVKAKKEGRLNALLGIT